MRARAWLLLFLYFGCVFPRIAFAETCVQTSATCTDSTACKIISGRNVCLSSIGETCWAYNYTFTCYPDTPIDNCVQPRNSGICAQYSSTCAQYKADGSGTCMLYTNKYDCTAPLTPPLAAGVTFLDQSFEIVRDVLNQSQCYPLRENKNCWKQSGPTCIEAGGTRTINGLAVTKDCWKYEEVYNCLDPSVTFSTCAPYSSDPNCTEQGTGVCRETLPNGVCANLERTFQCKTQSGVTTTANDCSNQDFCIDMGGGNVVCFKSGHPNDKDFANTITAMEMARQMGNYLDPGSMTVFGGTKDQCREGYAGLRACCNKDASGASQSNAQVLAAAMGAAKFGAEVIRYQASFYTSDILFNSADLTSNIFAMNLVGDVTGTSALAETMIVPTTAATAPAFSVYGFEFTYSAAEGLQFAAFDPVMFGVAIAIMVVMQLMSCETDEQILAMKRGADLCHYVGSFCSQKILGACVERTKSYCCFNSKLALIIQEQGRAQLGKGWGTGNEPQCGGLSMEEIGAIDFSRIDFAGFFTDVMKNTGTYTSNAAKDRLTDQIQNYYEPTGSGSLNQSYYSSGQGLPH